MSRETQKTALVFFGTDEFSVIVLEELKNAGQLPSFVVTASDKPRGRGMKLTPPPVKVWAEENGVNFLQPQELDGAFLSQLSKITCHMFAVASYGKIIPKEILDLPEHGTLNVHPSLLPKYRGASPIQSQIKDCEEHTGVSIILMDEKMDHGPILAQRELRFKIHNFRFKKLRNELAKLGGELLVETIPKWVRGEIAPQEQDHDKAIYTKKIAKKDGLINIGDDPEKNYRKFLAYSEWPGAYFFYNEKRVKITNAVLENGEFKILNIIPEGKKEIDYEEFLRNQ
jgi:methionyl-tRNA formyltransferase